MKFFVDSADIEEIGELNDLGLVDGVTTNPSLIMKSGRQIRDVVGQICGIVKGPVSAEVTATDYAGMIEQAEFLDAIADNIAVKVPSTLDGFRACKTLRERGRAVNVTLCFSATQALLAAKAGATFISPFVGRIDDMAGDGMAVVGEIRRIYDNYGFKTQVLASSIRTVNHVRRAALLGADAATIPPATLRALASHPLTDKGLEAFLADWRKTGQVIG